MLATKNPRKVAADAPAARVGRIYQDAESQLTTLLRRAIDRGAQGTARYLQTQLHEVNRIVDGAHRAATPWADQAVEFGYRAGMATSDAAVEAGVAQPRLISGFAGTTHRAAVERIARAQTSRLAGMRYEVGRQAMDVFRKAGLAATGGALAGGLTGQQAADRMKRDLHRQGITGFTASNGAKWRLSTYSQMVARTTTREAVTRGVTNRMMQNGDDLVEISDHGETDETCDEYAGNVYSLSGETPGYDVLDDEPPFHPNLTPDYQPVRLLGEARGGYRARYAGPLIEATTASGVKFAVGPNHPVLTARGWVPAKLLRNGDEVVRDLGFPRSDAPRAEEHLDDLPALPDEVFDALVARGDGTEIPSAPAHFHGDGRWVEGKIDVVRADGLLPYIAEAARVEQLRQRGFVTARVGRPLLTGERAALLGSGGVALAAPSVVSVGLGRPDAYAPLAQELERRAGGDPPLPRELAGRFPGLVARDELIEVRRIERWHGWAYDFETASVAYSSGGVIVSNCVHVMFPASLSAGELDEALGLAEPDLPKLDSPAPAEVEKPEKPTSTRKGETVEEQLQDGPVTNVRTLRTGVSDTYTANVGGHKAILKLSSRYREAENERAAYVLSQKLNAAGMRVDVPPTVLRTGKVAQTGPDRIAFAPDANQSVSAQQWSPGETGYRAGINNGAALRRANARDKHAMDTFDYVINNRDRHGSNYLVTPDEHLKLIDHGFAFDTTKGYSSMAKPKLVQAEADALRTLLRKGALDELRELLPGDNLEEMVERIRDLVEAFDRAQKTK